MENTSLINDKIIHDKKLSYISSLERELDNLKKSLAITQASIDAYEEWIDSYPFTWLDENEHLYILSLEKEAFSQLNKGDNRVKAESRVKELECELTYIKKLWKIPS